MSMHEPNTKPWSDEPWSGGPAGAPALAVGSYSEALVRGKRVAILGDSTLPLAEQLLSRGARLVHVYDNHVGRVSVALAKRAQGGRSPVVVSILAEDLGVRDGAFDVVIVPDLPLFGDDLNEIIRKARRLVSPLGVVVIASPNPEAERFLALPPAFRESAPSYYDLFDAVSLHFADVRMLGQAPFVGYAIVDFSDADPNVSVDTSLLEEPEAPEWYIAVASDRPQAIDSYSLVAVPLATIAAAMPDEHATIQPPPFIDPSEGDVELADARARIAALSAENERLRESQSILARVEQQASDATARASSLEVRVTEAAAESAAATLRVHGFERRIEELSAALRDAESARDRAVEVVGDRDRELHEMSVKVDTLSNVNTDLRNELTRQAQVLEANESQAQAALRKRITELEAQIVALDPPTLRSKEMREQRIATLEAQRNEWVAKEKELRDTLTENAAQISELARRADAAEAAREALERDLARRPAADSLQTLEAAVREERSNVAELEAEIARGEAALRRRGRDLVEIQRENAELSRVGKELLRELLGREPATKVHDAAGTPAPKFESVDGDASQLKRRLDDALLEIARREADRVATAWKISQLTRAASPEQGPDDRVKQLERALFLAQQELAKLRLRGPAEPSGEEAALTEQTSGSR